jgi:hypothetical protein
MSQFTPAEKKEFKAAMASASSTSLLTTLDEIRQFVCPAAFRDSKDMPFLVTHWSSTKDEVVPISWNLPTTKHIAATPYLSVIRDDYHRRHKALSERIVSLTKEIAKISLVLMGRKDDAIDKLRNKRTLALCQCVFLEAKLVASYL